MKKRVFNKIVDRRIELIIETLGIKGEEYSSNVDCLHNFKKGAKFKGSTPEDTLWGQMVKHLVSISDMIDDVENTYYDVDKWDEKIGDAINYLILLEACLAERRPDEELTKAE